MKNEMNQFTGMEAVTIKPGFGYWDVTRFPKGGDFRRAKTELPLSAVTVTAFHTDGTPREFVAMTTDGRRVCVPASSVSIS